MRHIFRINVYQKGYSLYSGYGPSSYQEFPLDIQSSDISRNYLYTQRKIDDFLETQTSRWCFCLANNYIGDSPVTAYGCLLSVRDDTGRLGISFIHGIESDETLRLDQVVICIAHLLSQKMIDQASELIVGVARGQNKPGNLIDFFVSCFREMSCQLLYPPLVRIKPIKEIQQDCGGASIVAWLAMTISHLNIPPPWNVYEKYSNQTKIVSAISSLSIAQDKYLLSEYLYKAGYVKNISIGNYSRIEDPLNQLIVPATKSEGKQRSSAGKLYLRRLYSFLLIILITVIILIILLLYLYNQNMDLKNINMNLEKLIEIYMQKDQH